MTDRSPYPAQSNAPPLGVLCVGCGNMGRAHAIAYLRNPGFHIVGLVSRGPDSRTALARELAAKAHGEAERHASIPTFADYADALRATRPDAVCISTYPNTHAEYARLALEAGAHVFVEKPIATTVEDARALVAAARAARRKLVVGYILHQHPSWAKFVDIARNLGNPLVMRMNLNQQSHGRTWHTHKMLMESMSPIVDCGVHYVDMMCRMTRARPVRVSAIGARLSDELRPGMYNYGQLQVTFDDGSVGWYEAGWGPMMSEEAYFIKDVIGPRGSVSMTGIADTARASDNVDKHSSTCRLRVHTAATNSDGSFAESDRIIDMSDEPDHQALCDREQAFFLRAIREDLDLDEHQRSAVDSLRVVLAADESVRTGRLVTLD